MATVSKTRLIRIGNSRGIRIPRLLLELAAFHEDSELELVAESGQIVVRPVRRPRQGWEEQIRAEGPDDQPLDPLVPTQFDENEWDW